MNRGALEQIVIHGEEYVDSMQSVDGPRCSYEITSAMSHKASELGIELGKSEFVVIDEICLERHKKKKEVPGQ
jgi:hypothetical protein